MMFILSTFSINYYPGAKKKKPFSHPNTKLKSLYHLNLCYKGAMSRYFLSFCRAKTCRHVNIDF